MVVNYFLDQYVQTHPALRVTKRSHSSDSKLAHMRQFIQKLSAILARAFKKVYHSCPIPKYLRNIYCKEFQVISLSGAGPS